MIFFLIVFNQPGASALPTSASPSAASGRKFGDKGLVSLEQISCREDLNELSIKQMKELLTLNRVNFKGVTERDEMLKLVERLWMSERTMTESGFSTGDTGEKWQIHANFLYLPLFRQRSDG